MSCVYCEQLVRVHQLRADELIAEFDHSYALLGLYQYFEGYCILVSKVHARELHELPDDFRHGYLEELNRLSCAITAAFQPRKLNCELLGNQVPHPHWHIFPRYDGDPDRLKPAWLAIDRAESDGDWRRHLIGPPDRLGIADRLRNALVHHAGG